MDNVVADAYLKLQSLQKDSREFRLLDGLLTHAPTEEGRHVIATDIIDASGEHAGLQELAEFYKTGLLLPMRAGGKTPQVSFHPSREEEIETEAEDIAIDIESAKRDQAKLKKYTLRRDGYRCVMTRSWDYVSARSGECQPLAGDTAVRTQAAHILPFSLMSVTPKTLFKKCQIWSVIKSFTKIEFTELNGDIINTLSNVLTLTTTMHEFFGALDVWLEAVPDKLNTYKIRKAQSWIPIANDTEITLTSSNPTALQLPDPRYLAFHAAIANVVHMAGMSEHLDGIIRDRETFRVLSDDSGVEYLDELLHMAQRRITVF